MDAAVAVAVGVDVEGAVDVADVVDAGVAVRVEVATIVAVDVAVGVGVALAVAVAVAVGMAGRDPFADPVSLTFADLVPALASLIIAMLAENLVPLLVGAN